MSFFDPQPERQLQADMSIELPTEWRTAPFSPHHVETMAEAPLPGGRLGVLVIAMLMDGTNIVALKWPNGLRLARATEGTGWAIEERFTGRPPGRGEGALIELWRIGVEAMAHALRQAREEMDQDPDMAELRALAVAVAWDPVALDHAYEHYDHKDRVTREQFAEMLRELGNSDA